MNSKNYALDTKNFETLKSLLYKRRFPNSTSHPYPLVLFICLPHSLLIPLISTKIFLGTDYGILLDYLHICNSGLGCTLEIYTVLANTELV